MKIKPALLTPIPAALSACLVAAPLSARGRDHPSDKEIGSAVVNHLLFDSSVPSNDIDVVSSDGIVTLSGTAPNLLAKDRAAVIAGSLKGVRSVVNRIKVTAAARGDDKIRKDVEAALKTDPATEAFQIATAVEKGVVTLKGEVDSWREKQLAASVAKSVKGVRELQNNLELSFHNDRPDNEIAAEVKETLDRDVWVDDALVHVDVTDGKVMLTGSVGSVAEKTRAHWDAWTTGVSMVDDGDLKVEPWADTGSNKRERPSTYKSDEEVRKSVKEALMLDPRVFSFNPDISVRSGSVTLSGVVNNLKAKRAAVRDAKNTVGVWRVRDHLKVRTAKPVADDELADKVRQALVRDPYVDRYKIGASAIDGTVYLSGTVDSYYEKSHAEDVASRVKGVVSINNGLVVSYPSYTYYSWPYSWYYNAPYYYNRQPGWWSWPEASDAEIKADIENELFWSPFLDRDKISVAVNNGVATLTGTVDSWTDFNSAAENAYQAGAHTVLNQLKVKSESQ